MIRLFAGLTSALLLASPIFAHFVYVLPQKGGEVQIVFSDELAPDENVAIEKIAALELFARDEAGQNAPLKTTTDKHSLKATAPAGTRVVFGTIRYGVLKKGDAAPFQLQYHPKAILGDALATRRVVGGKLPVEVLAIGKSGDLRFQAIANGRPLAGAELNVMVPGGERKKVTTDADGVSPPFVELGRFGVWTKLSEKTPGELAGKQYEEIRHYATLVIDVAK